MSKRILEINKAVPVTGRLHHFYPLSIIMTDKRMEGWLYSNFFQLTCGKTTGYQSIDLNFLWNDADQWLDVLQLHVKYFPRNIRDGLIDFLIDSIDSDKYVYISLNDFYIPEKTSFMRKDFPHCNLIYGYDKEQRIFYTVGYDSQGKLRTIISAFADVAKAFVNCPPNQILILKRKSVSKHPSVRLSTVQMQIKDYIASQNTCIVLKSPLNNRYNKNTYVYGLKVYEKTVDYLKALMDHNVGFDIRNMHVLLEHKSLMVQRLGYYRENYVLGENNMAVLEEVLGGYQNIELAYRNMKNIFLKCKVSSNKDGIHRIIVRIQEMREQEERYLNKLLKIFD
jgi:hypothetical protein